MACDPDTLLEEARCLQCLVPEGMEQAVTLAALCALAGGGGLVDTGILLAGSAGLLLQAGSSGTVLQAV